MSLWSHLILVAVCSAGQAALLIALINRADALPIRRQVLKLLGACEHLALAAYPAILWGYVTLGAATESATFWERLPDGLRWYSYACLCLAVLLPMQVIQHLARRRPALLEKETSRRVDVAAELGFRPLRREAFHALTWIPGNEILTVQITEKHLRHPRLPAAWDGLTILHLSDVHFTGEIERAWFTHVFDLGKQMRPDLIVFTGDLLDRPELLEWLPETFGRLHAPLGCWFVLGNHDWFIGDADTRQGLASLGWRDATAAPQVIEHRGHPLAIAGSELPWMGDAPELAGIPTDAFRILLSHSPDQIGWAKQNGIDLLLAGHTHGGQVRFPLLGPLYCPSLHGIRYSDGVYYERPTLMHVSRGLSGEAPLRLNCPPELTRLVLRRA